MPRHQLPWSTRSICTAAAALLACLSAPVTQAVAQGDVPAAPAVRPPWENAEVKLHFFNATWDDVLRDVAEQSGSELVLYETPPGRVTRRDIPTYSRSEAVAILNRELSPEGFRILEKNRYLIVMHARTLRTRYRPPVQASEPEWSTKPEPRPTIIPRRRPEQTVTQITPAGRNDAAADGKAQEIQLAGAVTDAPNETGRVKLASGSAADATPAQSTEPGPVQVLRTSAPARDVARPLYEALKSRSRLVDQGPNGLPAFEVFDAKAEAAAGERAPRFAIGIDQQRNELAIEARPDEIAAVLAMLRQIDAALKTPGETTRVIADQPAALAIGRELGPELNRLSRGREAAREAALQGNMEPQFAQVFRQNVPPADQPGIGQPGIGQPGIGQPPAAQPGEPPAGEQDLRDLIGRLRGDVQIESVPDLGVLILRGNQADVDAVMQIIRQIELQARGTTPGIQLLLLQHVDSVALAQLLGAVYQQLTALRTRVGEPRQRVAFIPIVRPNALLILAPEVDMESILRLANELDRPVDPTAQVEIFRLQHAVATQVATQIETFFAPPAAAANQPQAVIGLQPRVRAIPDVRTNSVIVQARPNDLAEVSRIIRQIDMNRSAAVNKLRIFPLEHALADELAVTINLAIQSVLNPGAIQPGGAGGAGAPIAAGGQNVPPELREAKSVMLEFLAIEDGRATPLTSGLLTGVSVTPDFRSNSLVVSAPERTIQLMAALIDQLDRPSPTIAEIKVFSLTNADATTMIPLLENLFQPQGPEAPLGIQVAGAEDASSGLVPMRFSVDPRTNSIIAIGGAAALSTVEAILLRLDETDVRQRQTVVIKLRNAPALNVADTINIFLQSQRDLLTIDPELISTVELLEREIVVVPELVSNSLLVSATPRYFEQIQRIIAELDAAPPQVIIQAMLVEVTLDNTDEFGVELGFQDDVLFSRSGIVQDTLQTISQTITAPNGVQTSTQQIISQELNPGFNFNNQPLGNNNAFNSNPSSVGEQGLSNFNLGRVNSDLGFGGLVLSASSSEVSVLIRALAARRQVHILSRPQIRTLNNQLAQIQVGSQIPRVNGFTPSTGIVGPTPLIEIANTGIILTVTPRISDLGEIVMEVVAEKSDLSGQTVPLTTTATTGTTIDAPIINITTARTTVSVPNGQTIVLGGMITKSDNTIERKVPWLGDIPYLGTPFRYDSTRTQRTELLIFLTPRIIRTDADSELVKQVESERLHFLESEAEAIHGPLFSIPGPSTGDLYSPMTGPEFGPHMGPEFAPEGFDGSHESEIAPVPAPEPNPKPNPVPDPTRTPTSGPVLPEEASVPTTVVPAGAFQQTGPLTDATSGQPGMSSQAAAEEKKSRIPNLLTPWKD